MPSYYDTFERIVKEELEPDYEQIIEDMKTQTAKTRLIEEKGMEVREWHTW